VSLELSGAEIDRPVMGRTEDFLLRSEQERVAARAITVISLPFELDRFRAARADIRFNLVWLIRPTPLLIF